MKTILSILSPIILIFLVVSGTYYYLNMDAENFKKQNDKFISLINDSHEFDKGLTNLKTLTTEKAKETLKYIDKEIEIATALKETKDFLENSDIENATNKLEDAIKLDNLKIFTPAVDFLNNDIENYNKALEKINELDKNDENLKKNAKEIVDKYTFNYISIRQKLLNLDSDEAIQTESKTETLQNNQETKNTKTEQETTSKKATTTAKKSQNKTTTTKEKTIPNTSLHPQINGQQVPETYNTIRYTEEGAASRSIIENELKGDISNFTNEQIDDAIKNYNEKLNS